jgi:hypothetical protein
MLEPVAILKKFAQNDNVPHALLFTGGDTASKKRAALDFIGSLIPAQAAVWDLFCIDDPVISIEKIRELKQRFLTSPIAGSRKTALIVNAGEMRHEAANALLKLLEEPSGESLLILIAPSRSSVLSTISSRALEIKFPRIDRYGEVEEADMAMAEVFRKGTLCEKFRAAQKYTLHNKPELLSVLDAYLVNICRKISAGEVINFAFSKKVFRLRKVILSTNANPQLLLEELFVRAL